MGEQLDNKAAAADVARRPNDALSRSIIINVRAGEIPNRFGDTKKLNAVDNITSEILYKFHQTFMTFLDLYLIRQMGIW